MSAVLRRTFGSWSTVLAGIFVLLVVFSSTTNPDFLGAYSLQSAIATMSERALMAVPLALLVLVREIDISIASTAALSGIVLASTAVAGVPLWGAVALAIVTGVVCGAVNGVLVTVLRMPSLLVTLGTLSLYRGLCYVAVGGAPVLAPQSVIDFGNNTFFGTLLPWSAVPAILALAAAGVVLHLTSTGRRLYAIGGNPATARYSGVRSARLTFLLFVASGVASAIAGIIATGRTSAASPANLLGAELDCVTVVFLGGFSFLGGSGRISGLVWAILLIVALRSILLLDGFSGDAQATAVGILLILSLLGANFATRVKARLAARRARTANALALGTGELAERPV